MDHSGYCSACWWYVIVMVAHALKCRILGCDARKITNSQLLILQRQGYAISTLYKASLPGLSGLMFLIPSLEKINFRLVL